MLTPTFFNRDALLIAKELLGKVIYKRYNTIWLAAKIVGTEAYYLQDKGSHASLGWTAKRNALLLKIIVFKSIFIFVRICHKRTLNIF
jgi:DNA-3-methyladenine glycosylase